MSNATQPHTLSLPQQIPVKPKKSKATKVAKTKAKAPPTTIKVVMTVAMGVGIPLLSFALTKIAGTLAAGGIYILAFMAFALMTAILSVSLSHLAWAIKDITRSTKQASWAMAVSLDLSLVMGELVHVYADTLGLDAVATAVMVSVALASMVLNCWAFLEHP